jgi:iron complex outermembrane receptor protein
MTVRGSKGSQINVTLNGITLNDAESQEVFWVNIPALSTMISSVQLQRGLGTSAAGSGAFGASINMSTASVGADPFATAEMSAGSFGTFVSTFSAGTGLMKSGLYFNAAYSRGLTDGYIRNAYADVQSAMAVLGWMDERNSLRLTYLMGDQHTGITWEGISPEQYEIDRRYNPAGEYHDQFGNVHYYDNETDNYAQHHLQLNYTRSFADRLTWSTTFNYTRGDGYYENYKAGKSFSKYLMEAPQGYDEGDFITR